MYLVMRFCTGCGNRLSVVDTDGICLSCSEWSSSHPLRPTRAGANGHSVEGRAQQATKMSAAWSDPAFRNMMIARIQEGRARALAKRAKAAAAEIFARGEPARSEAQGMARARRSAAAKAAWSCPEKRAAIIAGQKAVKAGE